MNLIEKEREIINELVLIYSDKDFQDELEGHANQISVYFKGLLNDVGHNFGLTSETSVHKIKYYSLVHRVKESDSLNEKFYRNNLLSKEFGKLKFVDGKDVQERKLEAKSAFKKCDDIIGVKILTDLNNDCVKVFSILKDNELYLKENNIVLQKKDLENQPTPMKNGLFLYKIKGTYIENIAFELQIKSKLQSVWGDMEHSLFYKNYYISPVKDISQATMNHIGKLIFQIDEFLLSVRAADHNYKSKSDFIDFLEWFDKMYKTEIKLALGGIGFSIDKISNLLFNVFLQNKTELEKKDKSLVSFDHFELVPISQLYKDYVYIRNQSYDLKLLESILVDWINNEPVVTSENIDLLFEKFFESMVTYIAETIKHELPGEEIEKIKIRIIYYFDNLLKYKPDASVFLDPSLFVKHFIFMSIAKAEIDNSGLFNAELIVIENADNDIPSINKIPVTINLDLILISIRCNGDWEMQLQQMALSPEDNSKYREILGKIKDVISETKDKYKNELSFVEKIMNELK